MSKRGILIVLGVSAGTLARAQPVPPPAPAPTPAPEPPAPAAPAPTPTPAPTELPTDEATRRAKLDKQVEDFDWEGNAYAHLEKSQNERRSGFFVGANLAYATRAKVEVTTSTMQGTVDFPAVFGAELQVGYRFFPFLSVALVPQMFFNLKPDEEESAREIEVFVQATGHLVLSSRWDVNGFVAPGYGVLMVPGAGDAKGLAFRWGGGPMFHVTEHISFAAEFSHQLGFQRAERMGGDVDMETSFFSLLAGVRFRL